MQPDGRIIAVGHDAATDANCNQGKVFVVTRWSANGQFETSKLLSDGTNVFSNDRALAALISVGGKVIISGAHQGKATMIKLNLSDLSFDTTIGTNGIYSYPNTRDLSVKAIQRDGKILGADSSGNFQIGNGIVRFNANGTSDQSFGNASLTGNGVGRLQLNATYNGATAPFQGISLIAHPDGKFNILGQVSGGNFERLAIITQQNTTLRSGIYSDFTNDGKADISVFRSGT